MATASSALFSQVKHYLKLSRDVQLHLLQHPFEWHKFQGMFNSSVEKISLDLLQFEKNNMARAESKIYKFKRIFEKRYRRHFLYGELPRWTFNKPFGYAGDFKIIDEIYQDTPRTIGFDGLWDTYYLQMTACRATRQRKDDLKQFILDFAKKNRNRDIRIMNLASGPAREIKELLDNDTDKIFSKVTFDCYDLDINALNYAKELIHNSGKVNFIQKNAIRLALKKDIKQEISTGYNMIYSTGLFDYLDDRVAIRLLGNLRRLLKKDGLIIIANFGNKYCNSSAGLMEWATEWYLIYRTEAEFRKIFLNAGFFPSQLKMMHQPDKVIQYCFASAD